MASTPTRPTRSDRRRPQRDVQLYGGRRRGVVVTDPAGNPRIQPGTGRGVVTTAGTSSAGHWEPLSDGYVPGPSIVFSLGDVIMCWVP